MAYEEKEEGAKPRDDEEILKEARECLRLCIDEEAVERAKMLDDLRFCSLDQWPEDVRKEREDPTQEGGPRPCLTLDKVNQYIVQVVNDVRQGRPGIIVRPQDDAADINTAKMLRGLVRNIEDQSKADIPYSTAVESAARIGLGYFRITAEYVDELSDEQELFIRPIPNTFSVYLGKHIFPDGSDAQEGFITETMPVDLFKEKYPGKKASAEDFDGISADQRGYWWSENTITVVEYYCFETTQTEAIRFADGSTMSAEDYAKRPEGVELEEVSRRPTTLKQLKWYKLTGAEILDSRDLPGQFIPIVEVVGRESWVDGRRILWGLVRPAKDPLRMYNYWASMITEKLALAPKQAYVGAVGQFATMGDRWKQANKKNFAYLEYDPVDVNGNPLPRPERVGPAPIEAGYMKHQEVIEHDVQTAVGIFKAGIGESESQQSGRAILALQRESDTGTYHFGANLGVSIRHGGRILVDLIPHYYDTKRIVRILGEDGEVQSAQLDPELETAYSQPHPQALPIFNPGVGKYDVSITVGPSYNTKRMEAAATYVELAKGAADPISAALLRYLTVKNSDFDSSQQDSQALKALLPPQVIQAMSGEAQQHNPQDVAIIQQLQQQLQVMQQELAQEQAGTKQAQMKVAADHDAKMKQLNLDRQVEAEKARLAREQAAEEAQFARQKADLELELERHIAQEKADIARIDAEQKMLLARQQAEEDARLAREKQEFERQCHAEEMASEQAEKDETEAESLAPQLIKAFQQMLEQQAKFNAELIAVLKKDDGSKVIKLSGIQRTAQGITGATATIN